MRAPRRGTAWIDTLVNSTLANAGGDTVDLMGSTDTDERRGMTVTRLLLCLYLFPSDLMAVEGAQACDLGIGVASEDAFGAGALADPNVAGDEPLRGWLYRCRHVALSATGSAFQSLNVREDIHSQRKIDKGTVYMRIDNVTIQGTAFTVRIAGTVRMLVKLP